MKEPVYHKLAMYLKLKTGVTLQSFQESAVIRMMSFLTSPGMGVYNASEMGLGKTIQTIVAIDNLNVSKTLVIAPAGVLFVWEEEIKKFSLSNDVKVIRKPKDFHTFTSWTIISYDTATKISTSLKEGTFEVLVIDESHFLKNLKAKRTKEILRKVWPKIKYHVCLSGTPFTNNVVDGYSLFHKLCPSEFPDWYHFCNTFAYRRHNGFGIKYEGLKNAEKLCAIIYSKFFLRYKKVDVLPELPSKQFIKVPLPHEYAYKMTKDEALEMERYRQELTLLLGRDTKLPIPPVTVAEIRHKQGLKKVPIISDFIKNLLEQNIPVVLFCIHIDVIEQFRNHFEKEKPAIISGKTSNRLKEVSRFQSGDTGLFIGQLQAAGTGITLTRSSNVILAELSYSPADIAQGIDRCHRIGQKDSVQVHYFSVKDSIDERIIDVVMEKAKNFSKVLDGKEAAA